MTQRNLTMRKIKEILRLKWGLGLSDRQTSVSLKVAHSTVGEYVKRAERAGLDWSQAENMPEAALKDRLFPVKKADPAAPAKGRCIIQSEWRKVSIRNCPKALTTYTSVSCSLLLVFGG